MSVCGHADRFPIGKSWWRRWCDLEPDHAGSHFEARDPVSIPQMYEALLAKRAELDGVNDEPDKDEEAEEAVTIVEQASPIAATDLGTSPKGIWTKVQLLGWEATISRSLTRHAAVLYATANETHAVGDVRYAAHDQRHYFMSAVDSTRKVGFYAEWMGKGEGKSAAFISALLQDPVGIPTELFFDYSPNINTIRARGEAQANEIAEAAHRAYNDGTSVLERRHLYTKATDLNDWLAEWMTLAGIEQKPKTPPKARKPKGEYTDQEIATTREWIAA